MYVNTREAVKALGLHPNTLRKYADTGKIKFIRTPGGKRLYDIDSFTGSGVESGCPVVCYCRVSSGKQKDDLARQVAFMRENFPEAQIIQDIGSGLNFKRKGLQALLDRLLQGDKFTLIVAHRDRLARFATELFEHMLRKNGGELLVLDRDQDSPEAELTKDILSILHVFSCRINGLRRYASQVKEDKDLPHT